MDDTKLKQLQSRDAAEIRAVLEEFNKTNADLFNFDSFHHKSNAWHNLWRAVFSILNDLDLSALHPLCLNTVRILTRDAKSLAQHDITNELNILMDLAYLSSTQVISSPTATADEEPDGADDEGAAALTPHNLKLLPQQFETIAEALKCLCNLAFQSLECCCHLLKNFAIEAIVKRMTTSIPMPSHLELYDMKLLFLLTALEPAGGSRVNDLNGIAYMTEWLGEKLLEPLNSEGEMDLVCEILKVMFNVTSAPDKSPNEEGEIQNLHLTGVVRDLLLRFGDMATERQRSIVCHAINLLTNMSTSCLVELMLRGDTQAATSSSTTVTYEGHNLRALQVLLDYLQRVVEEHESSASPQDLIAPILTLLVKCARSNSTMRHFIRSVVLPPLHDVSKRPEVGNELRNRLCRFLTLPSVLPMIRDLTAELLFVCCKENVGRMIKYTGYGNAAGLFAKRGLLDCRQVDHAEYSSDSEDSDTEEYKKAQPYINPVLGCYEAPKKSPFEGMSEEQKEYEAMKLVDLMDKLHRSGVVQPCRVGEDGRPQPVEHILQLQEELPQQKFEQKQET